LVEKPICILPYLGYESKSLNTEDSGSDEISSSNSVKIAWMEVSFGSFFLIIHCMLAENSWLKSKFPLTILKDIDAASINERRIEILDILMSS